MKILPVKTISTQQVIKSVNSDQKANVLPKTIKVEQNLSNPTFKNCGAQQAAVLAGCSTFGIT